MQCVTAADVSDAQMVGPLVRRRQDNGATDGTAAGWAPMTIQVWHTLVVRAWRDHNGLKVRFLAVEPTRHTRSLAVETTEANAIARFASWLTLLASEGDVADASGKEGTGPADGQPSRVRRADDETTNSETTAP
jgi:hypothetical protein